MLAAALAERAAADPGRTALHVDGGSRTRGQLQDAIDDAARTLRDRWSVSRGQRVAYLGLNRHEELVLLFALARIGAIFVPLNTRLAAAELAGIVAHAQLHTLVTDPGHHDLGAVVLAGASLQTTNGPPGVIVPLRSIDDLDEGPHVDRSSRDERIDAETPVLMVYTSGATGAPKAAVHTHAGLLANARASIAAHAMTEDDRVLTVLPLFHVGGLCIQTLPALLAGASVVLHSRFDANAWFEAIATMRPTLTLMVPVTLRAVTRHSGWPMANLSCLRVLMAGSSVVPRQLIDAVHARNVPLGQVYGSTETGPMTVALTATDALRKPGFAGWPCFPDSIRLVDASGADVVPGSVGEIMVRAPNVMQGYWREPSDHGFRDGWFATGDLGRFDDEGCLEVVGRNRDLIITGGEHVYAAELEDVLMSIHGVVDVAVIGVSDDRWGEVPAAFVVRGDGKLDASLIEAAFVGRLARFKHPKHIVFVDQVPRNAMGKVQVQRLREGMRERGVGSLPVVPAKAGTQCR